MRSSLIEESYSSEDRYVFLTVPLVAQVFGKKKLAVSPLKIAIEADTNLLRSFGASQRSDVQHGIAPRVSRLFRSASEALTRGQGTIEEYRPILEFVAGQYPPGWLMLASLYEDEAGGPDLDAAREALLRYLEVDSSSVTAGDVWRRVAKIYQAGRDWYGMAHALVERALVPGIGLAAASNAANELNSLLYEKVLDLDSDEKQVLIRKLAEALESYSADFSATDCSRMAWLYLHLHETEKAQQFTKSGLRLDPRNSHCQSLARRLNI